MPTPRDIDERIEGAIAATDEALEASEEWKRRLAELEAAKQAERAARVRYHETVGRARILAQEVSEHEQAAA